MRGRNNGLMKVLKLCVMTMVVVSSVDPLKSLRHTAATDVTVNSTGVGLCLLQRNRMTHQHPYSFIGAFLKAGIL